jgi:hypothetical protein
MNAPSPFPMHVAPFPASRFEASEPHPLPDGFVDENVINALLSTPSASRVSSIPSDLVLSSDENDFAGWSVKTVSPFRVIAERQELEEAQQLSNESDPGIGEPHRNGHRWWIAAATGAASALLLSFLFANLADRSEPGSPALLTRSFDALQSAVGSLVP